jgi:DNA invertase Pin-like site-specific DNA recombinase
MRTRRPVFARVLLDLQTGKAGVLICDDVSRIVRDERDALDLIDACELGRASAFSPDDDSADGIGSLRITRGGTREEIRSFRERARAAHDYSADISDKVQRGRKRWAGKSYWGGRRPYGRMADPSAPKHAKRLLTVPEEAKVLQDAVTDVLDRGISLRAVAADLRARGMRTVTGKPFSAVSLRDALLASHVAGIATCNGARYDASSWLEPIIEPDRWERLADLLTDPSRRTNTGNANAPRWLLTGHARCGICADGTAMHVSGLGGYGKERGSAYRCDKLSHCATPAIVVDQAMTKVMIARLARDDIADLLPAPEPRPDVDVKALRAESRKLHAKRDDLARLLSEDILTEAGVRQERKRIDARLAEISTDLAGATQIDLLPELRAPGADPARVWKELSLPRQREIVRLLCDVTLFPNRTRKPFNPALHLRIDLARQRGRRLTPRPAGTVSFRSFRYVAIRIAARTARPPP